MQVYSSFPNVLNFGRSKVDIETVYKRYALLYDRVIFNRHGCPIGKDDLFPDLSSYIANAIVSKHDKELGRILAKNNQFKDLFIDMWDVFEKPETLNQRAFEYLEPDTSNDISKFSWHRNVLDEEMGLHNHHRENKAVQIVNGDVSSDLAFNLMMADKIDDFNMSLAPVIGDAIKTGCATGSELDLFTTDIILPDFESLTWDQILELRQDKYIKIFRGKVFSSLGSGLHIDEVLNQNLDHDLWYLAEQCKPHIGKRVVEIILSNIPLPTPVNPFSYYYGGKAFAQDNKNKDKAWVFVIQNMRKLS